MRHGEPFVWKTLAAVAVLVGFLLLIAAGGFFVLRSGWIDEAGAAQGEVVALEPTGRGYAPTVQFWPAGGDHPIRFTTSWSTSPPPFEIGDQVSVLYAPDHPSEASINVHFGLWWPLYVLGGIALLFALLGAIAGFVWLRTSQPRGG